MADASRTTRSAIAFKLVLCAGDGRRDSLSSEAGRAHRGYTLEPPVDLAGRQSPSQGILGETGDVQAGRPGFSGEIVREVYVDAGHAHMVHTHRP